MKTPRAKRNPVVARRRRLNSTRSVGPVAQRQERLIAAVERIAVAQEEANRLFSENMRLHREGLETMSKFSGKMDEIAETPEERELRRKVLQASVDRAAIPAPLPAVKSDKPS